MSKISFTVSARTAKLIGQENFATGEGAIIELVKNTYDADATSCIIVFDDNKDKPEDRSLFIIDDGHGMTQDIIKNQWMKIGTDEKLANYLSKGGRVKTGAKGIGRFALDRLGLESEMLTVSEVINEDEETKEDLADEAETELVEVETVIEKSKWKVRWSDFDKSGIGIHQVEADLDEDPILDLSSKIEGEFASHERVLSTIDKIDLSRGTILKIHPLKDKWDENDLKSLFNNLEVLIPPKEQPEFSIHLYSTKFPSEFGEISSAYYDDFDYKVEARYSEDGKIVLEVTRDELNLQELESSYSQIFESELMNKFPFDLKTIKGKAFNLTIDITDLPGFASADKDLTDKIGAFNFTFYFLKNTSSDDSEEGTTKKYPYKSFSSSNRKAWLQKFGGVKVFRDDFRVRPYGENGHDWLGLGERQAKSPGGPGQRLGGYRIGPNQISGTVSISRIGNASFQDKSGREGIQENETFDLFKNLLVEIIALFEKDRNTIMYSLSELAKIRFKDEEEKRKAQQAAKEINQSQKQDNKEKKEKKTGSKGQDYSEKEVLLAKAVDIYAQEVEEKNEEIRALRGLASVGLIISSMAHELKSLRSRLVPRTEYLIKELKKNISEEQLSSVNKFENPFYMIKLIQEDDLKLKHWLDYSLSTLKRDKRKRLNINIGTYFEEFEANWKQALEQRKISLKLIGTKDALNTIRAFEVDLDSIFNNLLSNSITAFKEKTGSYQRNVDISWKSEDGTLKIIFSDNGAGLAKEYLPEPSKIFQYNETSKRDRKGKIIGTGMGLYIVNQAILDYSGATIKIIGTSGGFSVEINIPQRKS